MLVEALDPSVAILGEQCREYVNNIRELRLSNKQIEALARPIGRSHSWKSNSETMSTVK